MNLFPTGSSLIDIITRAKAMQGKNTAAKTTTTVQTPQTRIEDQVTLGPKLQQRIDASKKVNGYLQVFSAALKVINSGKSLTDLTSYLDKIDSSDKQSGKIDKKI